MKKNITSWTILYLESKSILDNHNGNVGHNKLLPRTLCVHKEAHDGAPLKDRFCEYVEC